MPGCSRWRTGSSANDKIFYGKDGVLTGTDRAHVEVSVLAPHLLQSCLVYVNMLLVQAVLRDRAWAERLTAETAAPCPRCSRRTSTLRTYGRLRLDMTTRLDLTSAA